jgi:hypothetical protein
MLNFAEQTGSGAVMLVWSFPSYRNLVIFLILRIFKSIHFLLATQHMTSNHQPADMGIIASLKVGFMLKYLTWMVAMKQQQSKG